MSDQVEFPAGTREQLDVLFRADRFLQVLGGELEDWGGGWSRVRWSPREEHVNFIGVVHGGAVAAIADAAFAFASNSWGRVAVALSIDVHYLAAPRVGAELIAEGRERSRRRRAGSYLIDVRSGDELVASLHSVAHRTDRWHLGDQAWPEDWRSRY